MTTLILLTTKQTTNMNTTKFKVGDSVICINEKPLSKTGFGPELTLGKTYPVKKIYTEPAGFDHLDIGLITDFEVIRSLDTGVELPKTGAAWCHPSRFNLATI